MNKRNLIFAAFTILIFGAASVNAQATRTWVSGVGDDANPCSRTAPCKTFAGAISKTAANGEISVLDPGGFGAVTITKSISITQDESGEGGILAALTNGVIINGAGINVRLHGLIIEGAGNGLNGIRFLQGASLHVQDCVIRGFNGASPNGHGINFVPSASAELYVQDTVITNNGTASTGGGVLIAPTGAAVVKAVFTRVSMENNNFGIRADGTANSGGINVSIKDGSASGNTNASILAFSAAGLTQIMVDGTAISNNGFGPRADGASAIVRIANTIVTGNGTGLSVANSGQLLSYGTNLADGNTVDGTASGVATEK